MLANLRFPLIRSFSVAACVCGLTGFAQADAPAWQTDFAAAKTQAKAEKKLLLVDFTGSDWCYWCKVLKAEVFEKEPFTTEAPKQFVLVELDFPHEKKLPEVLKKQNCQLYDQYKPSGFPVVLILDAEGQLIARTGYQPGGSEKYAKHLAELVDVYHNVVQMRGELAKAEGADRAKLLDQLIDGYIKLKNEIDDLPAWSKEVIALDGENKAGLKTKQQARLWIAEMAQLGREKKIGEVKAMFDKIMALPGLSAKQKQKACLAEGQCFCDQNDFVATVDCLKNALEAAAEGAEADHIKSLIQKLAPQAEAQKAIATLKADLEQADGLDRAKLLDQLVDVCQKVGNRLGGKDLSQEVKQWSQEIIRLDADNQAGLKQKYEKQKEAAPPAKTSGDEGDKGEPASAAKPAADDAAATKELTKHSDLLNIPHVRSQPNDKVARIAYNEAILKDAWECLRENVDVPLTARSHSGLTLNVMLPAAECLYQDAPTADHRDQLMKVAQRAFSLPIWDSSIPGRRMAPYVPAKVHAAYLATKLEIYPAPEAKPQDAEKHIRAMLDQFARLEESTVKETARAQAVVDAARLAVETGEKELADELCAEIAAKCLAAGGSVEVLAMAGHPHVLQGELTTLDGKKITLPADTKGKIVVLDFWATWCGSCVALLPHIKALHEEYKDRGVLVVGVSCDGPINGETPAQNWEKVVKLLTEKKCDWTQAYSGQGWPLMLCIYAVNSIPTVFVVDAEGHLLTKQGYGQEETLIEKELAKAASTSAAQTGPIWTAAPADAAPQADKENDYSAEDKKKIGDIFMKIKYGAPASVAACEALLKEVDGVLAANPGVPADAEYRDITFRRVKQPLVRQLYSLERTPARKAVLLTTLDAVCKCPRLRGHHMSDERPGAEYNYALLAFWSDDGKELQVPKERIADHIAALRKRYSGDQCDQDLVPAMLVAAAKVADKAGLKEIQEQLTTDMAKKVSGPGVIDYLISVGKAPVFKAELLTLDGKKLKLPEDTAGKVVVIDFWATWCLPCVGSMPHFKSVWEKYKDKGVVFIGESSDGKEMGDLPTIREKVKAFTTEKGYLWTHCASGTFSVAGMGYGILHIPHVMVIGKDGKIFKYQARGSEEAAIEAALKQ